MKYNEEQKYKVIKRGLCIRRESVHKRERLKKSFPIEVEILHGFYIVESKMNYE